MYLLRNTCGQASIEPGLPGRPLHRLYGYSANQSRPFADCAESPRLIFGRLDEETGAQMFRVAQRLAQALRRSGIKCEGINFFLADGEAAQQEVFHIHLHLFPRYAGDGFSLKFGPEYHQKPGRVELDLAAAQIRTAI
jgi:hypothetical protein